MDNYEIVANFAAEVKGCGCQACIDFVIEELGQKWYELEGDDLDNYLNEEYSK